MNLDPRALIVALDLLRRQVADLAMSPLLNAHRGDEHDDELPDFVKPQAPAAPVAPESRHRDTPPPPAPVPVTVEVKAPDAEPIPNYTPQKPVPPDPAKAPPRVPDATVKPEKPQKPAPAPEAPKAPAAPAAPSAPAAPNAPKAPAAPSAPAAPAAPGNFPVGMFPAPVPAAPATATGAGGFPATMFPAPVPTAPPAAATTPPAPATGAGGFPAGMFPGLAAVNAPVAPTGAFGFPAAMFPGAPAPGFPASMSPAPPLAPQGTAANPLPIPPPPAPAAAPAWPKDLATKAAPGSPANPLPLPPPPPSKLQQAGEFLTDNKVTRGVGSAGAGVEAGVNKLGRVGEMLAARFVAVLGPMAVFGAIIGSNASGFQVLAGSVRVLAGTLAPVLLPVAFVLATAFVALSDVLWAKIAPALEGFYSKVLEGGIPAIEAVIGIFEKLYDVIKWVADSQLGKLVTGGSDDKEGEASGGMFGGLNRTLGRAAGLFGLGGSDPDKDKGTVASIEDAADDAVRTLLPGGLGGSMLVGLKNKAKDALGIETEKKGKPLTDAEIDKMTGAGDYAKGTGAGSGGDYGDAGPETETSKAEAAKRKAPGGIWGAVASGVAGAAASGGTPGTTTTTGTAIKGAMGDVIKELRLSMGPRAQITGIAQASRNAQLAALNASPFEAKLLERFDKALSALERVSENTRVKVGAVV